MKKEITQQMENSIANWDNVFRNGIMVYEWPKVKERFADLSLDFEIPEDIKIALFAIHPDTINEIINYRGLTEWLGDSTIYELLTGKTKYNYTNKESIDLVKWYILNYWSFLYK